MWSTFKSSTIFSLTTKTLIKFSQSFIIKFIMHLISMKILYIIQFILNFFWRPGIYLITDQKGVINHPYITSSKIICNTLWLVFKASICINLIFTTKLGHLLFIIYKEAFDFTILQMTKPAPFSKGYYLIIFPKLIQIKRVNFIFFTIFIFSCYDC